MVVRSRSTVLPVFPLELWDMVIDYLRDEESAQHLSRLAQTCSMLYSRIEPSLYHPVRLFNSESGARLALTIERRPELAPRIREIRHKEDAGSEYHSHRHLAFYKMAVTLPNLEKLVLRNNPRPFDSERWGSQDGRDAAMVEFVKKLPSGSCNVKDWRDLGYGPPGESSFSPPAADRRIPFAADGSKETLFWHALLQHPPGLPALRVCHIGSNWDGDQKNSRMDANCLPKFNEALFRHQGLIKLCITGASFGVSISTIPSSTSETQLEELTLLNCTIDPSTLAALVSYPKALRRVTLRIPQSEDYLKHVDSWDYVDVLSDNAHSLEYLDYDLYWGDEDDADFGVLTHLKHLTTTITTLAGKECLELSPDYDLLPDSLESLTIRYDEVKGWLPSRIYELVKGKILPNLRRFTCEVPEIIETLPSFNESKTNPPALQICQEINAWKGKLAELNVELSAVTVSYPLEMPKYDICSCECLFFYHRMPFHLHAPLGLPWEESEAGVFYIDWNVNYDGFDFDRFLDGDVEQSESEHHRNGLGW